MNTERFDGHTPGPWVAKFDEHGVEGSLVVEGNNDGKFGSCASPLWVGESDKNMPDARLIAAAPELLAALVSVLSTRDKQRKRSTSLRKRIKRLENALMVCAQAAGDDPFFNEGGEGYEALFGGEEE